VHLLLRADSINRKTLDWRQLKVGLTATMTVLLTPYLHDDEDVSWSQAGGVLVGMDNIRMWLSALTASCCGVLCCGVVCCGVVCCAA
jgi:hypothetical protein